MNTQNQCAICRYRYHELSEMLDWYKDNKKYLSQISDKQVDLKELLKDKKKY